MNYAHTPIATRDYILADDTMTADEKTVALLMAHEIPGLYIADCHGLLGWESATISRRLEIVTEHLACYIIDAVAARLGMSEDHVYEALVEYRDTAYELDAVTVDPVRFYHDHVDGLRRHILDGCQDERPNPGLDRHWANHY